MGLWDQAQLQSCSVPEITELSLDPHFRSSVDVKGKGVNLIWSTNWCWIVNTAEYWMCNPLSVYSAVYCSQAAHKNCGYPDSLPTNEQPMSSKPTANETGLLGSEAFIVKSGGISTLKLSSGLFERAPSFYCQRKADEGTEVCDGQKTHSHRTAQLLSGETGKRAQPIGSEGPHPPPLGWPLLDLEALDADVAVDGNVLVLIIAQAVGELHRAVVGELDAKLVVIEGTWSPGKRRRGQRSIKGEGRDYKPAQRDPGMQGLQELFTPLHSPSFCCRFNLKWIKLPCLPINSTLSNPQWQSEDVVLEMLANGT